MTRWLVLLAALVAGPAAAQGPGLPVPPPQWPGTDPAPAPPGLPAPPPQVPPTLPPGTPPGLPGTPPQAPSPSAVRVDLRVILQGAYAAGLGGSAHMRTDLAAVLPATHPYGAAPWSHAGAEALADGLLERHDVVDWLLVCVRATAAGPDTACRAALLRADGSLLDAATEQSGTRLGGVTPGAYFVVVRHRNHLAAMTAAPVALGDALPAAVADLTTGAAFGTNALTTLGGGLFGLVAADADGDGVVDVSDRTTVWRPLAGGEGYLSGDLDLDGRVLADDRQRLWLPNVGRTTQVPDASLAPVAADR